MGSGCRCGRGPPAGGCGGIPLPASPLCPSRTSCLYAGLDAMLEKGNSNCPREGPGASQTAALASWNPLCLPMRGKTLKQQVHRPYPQPEASPAP